MHDELAALQTEVMHELWRWFVAVNAKGHKFPARLRVPRPHDSDRPKRRKATAAEAMAKVAALGVPVEVVPVGGGD